MGLWDGDFASFKVCLKWKTDFNQFRSHPQSYSRLLNDMSQTRYHLLVINHISCDIISPWTSQLQPIMSGHPAVNQSLEFSKVQQSSAKFSKVQQSSADHSRPLLQSPAIQVWIYYWSGACEWERTKSRIWVQLKKKCSGTHCAEVWCHKAGWNNIVCDKKRK